MEDGVGPSFETLRDLVVAAHLSDNHGERDEHLLPYDGTIDWAAAVKELSGAPAAAGGLPMVLELKESTVLGRPLEQVVGVFDKFDEALAAKT
jgi:sugar phosphate isomerase/epimerase